MSTQDNEAFTSAEGLVRKLYDGTASPDQVVQIQERLQELQRGDSAWPLAQHLLDNFDQNVRFFAALTFVIKINQDAHNLSEEAAERLRSTLITAFVKKVDNDENQIVLRKICSSLVAYLVQSAAAWARPIFHLVYCLRTHDAVLVRSLETEAIKNEDLASLSPQALSAILAFTTILAEDVSRVPHTSQYNAPHEVLSDSVEDAVNVMRFILQQKLHSDSEQQANVLQCYQAWISYARENFSLNSSQMDSLHELLNPLTSFLFLEDTFEATAEFFVDVFCYDQAFITNQDLSSFAALLQSDWSLQHLLDLEAGDADYGNLIFGQLVLAFGSAAVNLLIYSEDYDPVMELIHRITRSQRHSNIDQSLANQTCDFWDDYTMNSPDVTSDLPGELAAFTRAKTHWLQAIDELTTSASLPVATLEGQKASNAEDSLSEFRSRVRSTVQASYEEFGVSILQKLVELALREGESTPNQGVVAGRQSFVQSQAQLEVILYCLGDLSTSMEYHPGEEDVESLLLERFFTSPMFARLVQPSSDVAIALRKRAINIMSDQDEYFCSHGQHLLDALDMLFSSLQQASLSESAARAIRNLSDSGRRSLVPRVADFCNAARLIVQSANVSTAAKEDVLAAAGFVVQAMGETESQYTMLKNLITIIVQSVDHQSQLEIEQDALEARIESFLVALNQMCALAKAIQNPGIRTILLDDEVSEQSSKMSIIIDTTNEQVAATVAALIHPRDNGQLLEAACRILRVGYKETPLAYFAFKHSVTADLVTSVPPSNPRLDFAIDTAAAFLSSRLASSGESQESNLRLIDYVANLIKQLNAPSTDPELSHACVEFVSRLIPVHLKSLERIPTQYIQLLFSFTLKCLRGSDVLPKKSATNLWAALAGMSVQQGDFCNQLVLSFGPELTKCLVFNFGGDAARSEIEGLSRVYRKLIMKYSATKGWTEIALSSPDFPSHRVVDSDKRRLISQLVASRDTATTDRVIKEFWTLSRGTPAGYG